MRAENLKWVSVAAGRTGVLAACLLLASACSAQPDGPAVKPPAKSPYNPYSGGYGELNPSTIKFLDDAPSNSAVDQPVAEIVFQDTQGKEHPVREYTRNKSKHVVLVVTRGNTNPICPYCTTQTARLIKSYGDIQKRGAEVLLVYPVEKLADRSQLDGFLAKTREQLEKSPDQLPFPILLDLELKGVSRLGIKLDLSKPATYILDREGKVRYAYVGADRADRPSVDAVLKELDKLAPAPRP